MSKIVDMNEWRKKNQAPAFTETMVPAATLSDLFDQEERRIWEEFKQMACLHTPEKPQGNQ